MKRSLMWVWVSLVLAALIVLKHDRVVEAKQIAVIWDTKSAMVSDVVLGFFTEMRKLAPDVKISLHRQLKSFAEAKQVFLDSQSSVDGIVFLRSSGAKFLAGVKPQVLCFIGACNDPVDLGVVKNLDAPEGMVTGVTYYIPYPKRLDIMRQLFPTMRSVAIVAEKGHPSGAIDIAGTRQACQSLGITVKEVWASNLTEMLEGAKNLGKVDLVIVTNTRLVMDSVVNVLRILNPTKTPLFSYASRPVQAGAVAGLASSDTKLGAMLAESVVDVVARGKPISQVPVKMDTQPVITINRSMMRSLGLTFPEAVLKHAVLIEQGTQGFVRRETSEEAWTCGLPPTCCRLCGHSKLIGHVLKSAGTMWYQHYLNCKTTVHMRMKKLDCSLELTFSCFALNGKAPVLQESTQAETAANR